MRTAGPDESEIDVPAVKLRPTDSASDHIPAARSKRSGTMGSGVGTKEEQRERENEAGHCLVVFCGKAEVG